MRIRFDREPVPRIGKKKSKDVLQKYADEHPVCELCGGENCGNEALQIHHLVGGSGRSDEANNLLRVGAFPCHRQCEGDVIEWRGKKHQPVTLEEQVAAKIKRTVSRLRGQKLV